MSVQRLGQPTKGGRQPSTGQQGNGHHEVLAPLLDSVRSAQNQDKDPKAIVNMGEKRTGRTALIWACQKGHLECAKLLIDAGADVNFAESGDDDVGGTPLSWAITFGHLNTVQLLLKKGAICDEGEGKRPVLGWAAASGNVGLFKRLVDNWLDNHTILNADQKDSRGYTPFMLAASSHHVDMLQYLHANYHIRVHEPDTEGNTALLLAAGWGRLDAVR